MTLGQKMSWVFNVGGAFVVLVLIGTYAGVTWYHSAARMTGYEIDLRGLKDLAYEGRYSITIDEEDQDVLLTKLRNVEYSRDMLYGVVDCKYGDNEEVAEERIVVYLSPERAAATDVTRWLSDNGIRSKLITKNDATFERAAPYIRIAFVLFPVLCLLLRYIIHAGTSYLPEGLSAACMRSLASLGCVEKLGGSYTWDDEILAVSLSSTAVEDGDLVLFDDLPLVQSLGLSDCRVTDKGLQYLERLARLQKLDLRKTLVTRVGVDSLAAKLPSLEITWETAASAALD